MKRITSFILIIILVMNCSIVYADELPEDSLQYGYILYEYANSGNTEKLNVMKNNGNLYVDAVQLGELLGYDISIHENYIDIYNKDRSDASYLSVQFHFDDSVVLYAPMIMNPTKLSYQAPCAAIKDENTSWIPLEYSLLILNREWIVAKDILCIQKFHKTILDVFWDVENELSLDSLSIADLFEGNEKAYKRIAKASRVVNLFDGLLKLEAGSWADFFSKIALNNDTFYNAKYGDKIVNLLCISSDEEYKASLNQLQTINDIFSSEGSIGSLLQSIDEKLDQNVGTLTKKCNKLYEELNESNLSVYRYNRAYSELEAAVKAQDSFLNTGGLVLDVQNNITDLTGKVTIGSTVLTGLDIFCKVCEITGYIAEFQNQDEFATAALRTFLSDKGNTGLSNSLNDMIELKTDVLDSNVAMYSYYEYVKNNYFEFTIEPLLDSNPFWQELKVGQFAWNFISDHVPFYSEGLSATDAFETSMFASICRDAMWKTYTEKKKSILSDTSSINSECLYELAQLCYIYLKDCYVTQNTTIAAFEKELSDTANKKVLERNCENIAKELAILKNANFFSETQYRGLSYGFLPENNEYYLDNYNPDVFMKLVYDIDEPPMDNSYILPGSNSRIYDITELQTLSDEELELARNEIYARHGRKFEREDLQAYFDEKRWYLGSIEPEDFDENTMLSDVEKANLDLIRRVEEGTLFTAEKAYEGIISYYSSEVKKYRMNHPQIDDELGYGAQGLTEGFGYAYYDINQDGEKELLIGRNLSFVDSFNGDEYTMLGVDIYQYVDGKLYYLYEPYFNKGGLWCNDVKTWLINPVMGENITIFNDGTMRYESAVDNWTQVYYKINHASLEEEGALYVGDLDEDTSGGWDYGIVNEWGDIEKTTENEYKRLEKEYEKSGVVQLDWKLIDLNTVQILEDIPPEEWQKKYEDWFSNQQSELERSGEEYMGFEYIYLDNDSVPEIICQKGYGTNGLLVLYLNSEGKIAEEIFDIGFSYIEKTGVAKISYGHLGVNYDYICKFDNGKWVEIAEGDQDCTFENSDHILYYWNGSLVSEDEYIVNRNAVYDEQHVNEYEIPKLNFNQTRELAKKWIDLTEYGVTFRDATGTSVKYLIF